MEGKSILLVEDEYGTAEMLQLILEVEGFRVASAPNGQAALEQLDTHVPDVVLTDFMMPAMNGAQLGHALRAGRGTARLPIIMMSGVPESEVRRQFTDYDAFLQKPFRTAEVLAALRKVLQAPARRPQHPGSAFWWVAGLRRLVATVGRQALAP